MSVLSDASAELQEIANKYGYDTQSRQLIEEMAELTQAINKFWRKQLDCGEKTIMDIPVGTPEENNIAEEIADVEICLEQMKYLLQCDMLVDKYINNKIDRQLKRIKESEDK